MMQTLRNFDLMPIYLDNAATTFPKPEEVYRAVDRTLRGVGVASGRGGHRQGIEAARIVTETRDAVAALIGARDSSRIVFTHSTTEALNMAVKGVLKPGDHVISTSMEHNSLARPLHNAVAAGVEITWVAGDSDGYVAVDDIIAAISPSTRLVAMTHCSNVTGAVNQVEVIGPILKEKGILFLVDGAQSAGSIPVDVSGMNIDLFAAPGHKGLYGPPGTGFLYIGHGVEMEPLLLGGTGGGSTGLQQPTSLPEGFESGTMNTPAIAGLLAGAGFVSARGVDEIHSYELMLTGRLLRGLAAIPGIRVFNGDCKRPRCAVVSFIVDGLDPATIGYRLDTDYGISVRVGLHCSPLAHRTIGTFPEGTVRVSPGPLNSESDIDKFIEAMESITAGVKQ